MVIQPPVANVLLPEHPRLAVGHINNGGSDLVVPVRLAGVIPVVEFPAFNVGFQVFVVVGRHDIVGRVVVKMVDPVPPVCKGHIVVNANEVNTCMGPQRVQVEVDVIGPIVWTIGVIFGPVSRVSHFGSRANNGFHVRGKGLKTRYGRKRRGRRPNGSHAHHFRTNDKAVHTPCGCTQVGIVQDHTPKAPGAVEEVGHLGGSGSSLVHCSGITCRRAAGDPTAPGEDRLTNSGGVVAIGVRQSVPGRNVHEDERVEHNPIALVLQPSNGFSHHAVRRRSAIKWPTLRVK